MDVRIDLRNQRAQIFIHEKQKNRRRPIFYKIFTLANDNCENQCEGIELVWRIWRLMENEKKSDNAKIQEGRNNEEAIIATLALPVGTELEKRIGHDLRGRPDLNR